MIFIHEIHVFELWIEKNVNDPHSFFFLFFKYMNFMYQNHLCTSIFIIYRLIMDPHNDQHPVGLIVQMVEHCTGLSEVSV